MGVNYDYFSINNLLDRINIDKILEFVKKEKYDSNMVHSYELITVTKDEKEYCNDGGYYTVSGGTYKSYYQYKYNLFWCVLKI